jgi:murein L,D-transpeptidase YafK
VPAVAGALAWAHWPEPALPGPVTADRVLVDKSEHRLVLLRGGSVLKGYRVSFGADPVGHKQREGDERTPEGLYRIDRRNARSAFHRSLHVSYPDRRDVERARELGVAPGGDIMIHGIRNGLGWAGRLHRLADWTDGCIAVTNREMDELWRAVPDGTPIEVRP